ncbi:MULTISPECIES: hypothetical protein [Actinokineospora]|uniref:hypothetical protein n=1 Tax=Actinokineospora TaxID=39845 RepID=UPI0027E4E7A1|nr:MULTISPECIES: hypothetical protein [Actinokineospora]
MTELAAALLDEARRAPAHRAAKTLVSNQVQRATLIALTEGAELAEHNAPPAATLHVLSGQVRLHTQDESWELAEGHLAPVPPRRHGVLARTDAVVLLTVAMCE